MPKARRAPSRRPRPAGSSSATSRRKVSSTGKRGRPPSSARHRFEPAPASAEGERLQKVLAAAGVASRRAAEELIAAGRVRVDGEVVTTLGTRVDPTRARIEVDGKRVAVDPRKRYLVLNKPPGYITTARDERGRPTVLDLVRAEERLFPVGRLDADTTGLLILTNDGPLAHRLTHPRYQIERTYVAEVDGSVSKEALRALTNGVDLEDGPARAAAARVRRASRGKTQLEVVMTEGRKREVRRLLDAVGHPVRRLVRTAFGPIRLGSLPQGGVRPMTPQEVGTLQRLIGR